MLPYIAEFIGTMLLILLGDGVVANVNLERSGMKGAGAVQITFAWGLAVLVPDVYKRQFLYISFAIDKSKIILINSNY